MIDAGRVPLVEHGGRPPGSHGDLQVDLSLSTNPYGPPPYLALAIARGRREVAHYPDRHQADLIDRLAGRLELEPAEVLPAGSASELLRIAIVAFGAGRRVLLSPHTYGEYARVAASVGAKVIFGPTRALSIDPEAWAPRVAPRSLVVLANPGTPNGQYLHPREVRPLVEAAERRRALLLIDESYLPFVPEGRSLAGTSDNLLTVFSWSKVLGTPGLPLGHSTGNRDVIRALRAHILPWSVGPFARHLGLLALERPRWAASSLSRVERTAAEVRRRLGSASRTHYFLVRSFSATVLTQRLGERGFRVRDLTSLGLREYVRFAVRGERATREFLDVLRDVRSDVR